MSSDLQFLKTFITEEIYVIDRVPSPAGKTKAAPVASRSDQQPTQPAAELSQPGEPNSDQPIQSAAKLLIILKQPLQMLEASQKDLLTKITGAVKIDIAAVDIVDEAAYKNDTSITRQYNNVLSFGVELPEATTKYNVMKASGRQVLCSDSLAALEQAIALKGKLWKAMQQMFSVA